MPKINELFAFISTDEGPEDEGIIASKIGDAWMPLVGADQKRVDSLRPLAKQIAQATGKRVVLAKFTHREDVETIEAEGEP